MKSTIMIKIILISLLVSTQSFAMPGQDTSPPGLEFTYRKVGKILKIVPYNNELSWFHTESDSFLFQTNTKIDHGSYIVSKWEKWYCVPGFPGYCSKLLGLNGKIITDAKDYEWPKQN